MTTYAVLNTSKGWTVTVEHTDGRTFTSPSVVARKETQRAAERLARRLAGPHGRVILFPEAA
ncbi:hypothetical protein [Methylorubrum extorquens]|uniref:hypothetical protein n=1 Tax=Methylorubrum extorquens TaxID=408 RepID=UPI00209EBDEE|nr:hypothetical protein [Methylorubrum extorquens]MCP1540115.1 hypothetical protein [Methylorubrum extorquens]